MELIDLLVAKLEISEAQAMGGAGILLRHAKKELSKDEFEQIAAKVSGVDDIIAAAPPSKGGVFAASLGGLLSPLQKSGQIGALASLIDDFNALNIDSRSVNKFVSLVAGFIRERGGDGVGNLLDDILSSPNT